MLGKCPVFEKGVFGSLGVLRDVSNKNLEPKALEVFNKVGCEIPSSSVEACHCLTNSNDRIIVKF